MMKFVLRIRGGLGNQLFQYAMMRYLNLQYPNSKMYIDSRSYKKYKLREYELKSFVLSDYITDYKAISLKFIIGRMIYQVYQYIYRRIKKRYAPMVCDYIIDKGLIFSTVDFKMPQNLKELRTYYLYGYFGIIKYNNVIRNILINDFRLKKTMSTEALKYDKMIKETKNPVGVSIRNGSDYKKCGWPVCTPQFYRSGMDRLRKNREGCVFFIFSDTIDEVIEDDWFVDYNVIYVKGCSVVESFSLLKSCKDFVISNSTFSWWAAFLGEDLHKIVYASDYFYTEEYCHIYDKLMVFDHEKFLNYKTGEEITNIFS